MGEITEAGEIEDAYRYLLNGGLGETLGFATIAAQHGMPKIQMDTSHAMALCMLADEALKLRACRRAGAEAMRERAAKVAETPDEDDDDLDRQTRRAAAAAIRALEIEGDAK